jgi:proline dehydrogenase
MLRWLPIYSRFIAGRNIYEVEQTVKKIGKQGWRPILDYALEHDVSREHEVYQTMSKALKLMPGEKFAVKLTAFEPNSPLVRQLCDQAATTGSTLLIDAEQVAVQERIDTETDQLIKDFNTERAVIYKTYQMYRNDRLEMLQDDLERFEHLGVKLVRGAYMNEDRGTGKIWPTIEETHACYNAGAKLLVQQGHSEAILATHNAESCSLLYAPDLGLHQQINNGTIDLLIPPPKFKNNVGVAQLYGMADNLSAHMTESGFTTYKYLPFGPIMDTVPYLARRLYENYEVMKYLNK